MCNVEVGLGMQSKSEAGCAMSITTGRLLILLLLQL